MNILIVIPEMQRGGAENTCRYIANYFSKTNRVTIIVFDDKQSAYYLNENVNYVNHPFSTNAMKIKIPCILFLRNYVIRNHIECLVGFSIGSAFLVSLAGHGLSCKTFGSERSNPYIKKDSLFKKMVYNFFLSYLDGMIFTTKGCRDYYCNRIKHNSVIIPNGLFTEVHKTQKTAFSNCICAVGNLRPEKDYLTMIRAFAEFHKQYPRHKLYILGEGSERNLIELEINRLDMQEYIILCGSVKNPTIFYDKCDILIHSSISESWGNVILEALGSGLPCIATDCDFGPREMIVDGINGFLVPKKNYKLMAQKLNDIYSDYNKYRVMAENAYESSKKFNPEIIAQQYLNFFAK